MKVLYLRAPSGLDGAYPDFVKAIEGRFLFEVYDPDRPPAEQFEGVGVVVDPGGAVGTRSLIDAALAADVKLWQVTTNGTDHVDVAYFLEQGLPLANSPGRLSAVPLAEHVVMLILCFAKNLDHNRAAGWQRMIGEELAGKRLGRHLLAHRAAAFLPSAGRGRDFYIYGALERLPGAAHLLERAKEADAGHRHPHMGGAAAASGRKTGGVEQHHGRLRTDDAAADASVLLCPTLLHPRGSDERH